MKAFLFFLPALAFAGTSNHKAHVHGSAKLTLALESPSIGTIDLDVPAESIYGFEHAAKTAKDKKAQQTAFDSLKSHSAEVVRFEPSLSCTVTAEKVGLETEAHEDTHETISGEHSDVNASFAVKCGKPLPGSQVTIGLLKLFPRIKTVTFQVLHSTGQNQKTVHNDKESISL